MLIDETAGIEWYNGLTEQNRAFWHWASGSAVPADAYSFYLAAVAEAG